MKSRSAEQSLVKAHKEREKVLSREIATDLKRFTKSYISVFRWELFYDFSKSMMLTIKKDTDVHEFSRQLKDHLGEDFWVMIWDWKLSKPQFKSKVYRPVSLIPIQLENRAPAGPGNLKLFEENNFKLPKNFHHLYSDTNGVSLTWGHNSSPTEVKGHLGIEVVNISYNSKLYGITYTLQLISVVIINTYFK